MIDMQTMSLQDGDGLVFSSFHNQPYGILGVLESAKLALLSIPNVDKTQSNVVLNMHLLGESDEKIIIEITDEDFNCCKLIADKRKEKIEYQFRSIRATMKSWNSVIEYFKKSQLISENEAIVLSI